MKNVLLLCGGQSPEHQISIRSAKNVLNAINRAAYNITIVGISTDGKWRLVEETELGEEIGEQGREVAIHPGSKAFISVDNESLGSFDVVFPLLHGPNGEDGTVQGLLKLLDVPFLGPDVLGAAACMDKDVTKRLLRDNGINVADWITVQRGEEIPSFASVSGHLGNVLFVKPANMGSSVGVHRVENASEWKEGIKDAFKYDRKVLVEANVEGRELECAVLGNENPKASGVGEVMSGNFYSYEEKYADSSSADTVIPANINSTDLLILKETAIKAYKALSCEVLSRVDMFLTSEGDVYVNEINTMPGFTSISMYPKLWEEEGVSYSDLLDRLIQYTLDRDLRDSEV